MNIVDIEPHLFNHFNIENISYSKVYKRNDKKVVYITDKNSNKNIYIQTPELLHISQIIKKEKYYELCLPFKGNENNKQKVNLFKQFIKQLDDKIVNDASIHGTDWFEGAEGSVSYRSLIKNIHTDTIDTFEENSGVFDNGLLKFKVTDTVVISINSDEISIFELKNNGQTRIIFQIYALWISDNLFGLHLLPIKINQKFKIIENIKFIDDSSEELDNNFCCSEMAENKTSSYEDLENVNDKFSIIEDNV